MKYQLLRPLTEKERSDLNTSIKRYGVRQPIHVDENGEVLDGHHREEIAKELGVECPRIVMDDLSEEQKPNYVLDMNEARRHLTQEERRHAVVESVKANPEMSDRQHAKAVGVSHPTVAAVREELVNAGTVVNLTTTVGADGVTQPRPLKKTNAWIEKRAARQHPEIHAKILNGSMTHYAASVAMTAIDGKKQPNKITQPVALTKREIANQKKRERYAARMAEREAAAREKRLVKAAPEGAVPLCQTDKYSHIGTFDTEAEKQLCVIGTDAGESAKRLANHLDRRSMERLLFHLLPYLHPTTVAFVVRTYMKEKSDERAELQCHATN